MVRIICISIALTVLACEDNEKGFQGAKVEKEKESAAATRTGDEAAEATPPEMISGSYLWCDWSDETAGAGGCAILDRNNQKLSFPAMNLDWWRVRYRDGGVQIPTEFVLQPPTSPFHVTLKILQSLSSEERQKAQVVATSPEGYFWFRNLGEFVDFQNVGTISQLSTAEFSPLKDLSLTAAVAATLPEADRSFYFWPDPATSSEERGESAAIIADGGLGFFDPGLTFNGDAYCGAGGTIKSRIDGTWQTKLQAAASLSPTVVGIKPEVAKSTTTFYLPAYEDCIVPIRTGGPNRTAVNSDGSCLFMILRKRFPPPGFTEAQPYLLIFSKKFADGVGFTAQQMEAEAARFGCQ